MRAFLSLLLAATVAGDGGEVEEEDDDDEGGVLAQPQSESATMSGRVTNFIARF